MITPSLHLYGPLSLNGYNLTLLIGISLFMYFSSTHPARARIMSSAAWLNLCSESALAGIIGGRLLHLVSRYEQYHTLVDMCALWDGGLSVLGALAGVTLYSVVRLASAPIAYAAAADLAALFAPLIHACARVGCFLVGCCYGIETTAWWGVHYEMHIGDAPLLTTLHPTQLYSSLLYLVLFVCLHRAEQHYPVGSGNLATLYIIGMSLERFLIDFVRGDRIMHLGMGYLSLHQVISLAIFIGATGVWLYRSRRYHYEPV